MTEHLDPRIVALIEQSEKDGGIWLKDLTPGDVVKIQTKNTLYTLTMGTNGNGKFYLQGSERYCPTPTPATIAGSTWGGSMIKIGFIGVGMHLEFSTYAGEGKGVTTSKIQSVTLEAPTIN